MRQTTNLLCSVSMRAAGATAQVAKQPRPCSTTAPRDHRRDWGTQVRDLAATWTLVTGGAGRIGSRRGVERLFIGIRPNAIFPPTHPSFARLIGSGVARDVPINFGYSRTWS